MVFINNNPYMRGLYSLYLYDVGNTGNMQPKIETANDNYNQEEFYSLALPENWNREAKRPRTIYYSSPYLKNIDKPQKVISFSSPIYSSINDNLIGVSLSDVSLEIVHEMFTNIVKTGPFNTVIFDSRNKKIVYHDNANYILSDLKDIEWINNAIDNTTFYTNTRIRENYKVGDNTYTLFFKQFDNGFYNIFMYVPTSFFYNVLVTTNNTIFTILIVAIIVIIVVLNITIPISLKPLDKISQELESGVFDNNIFVNVSKIHSRDSLGDLSTWIRIFFDMVQHVFSSVSKTLKVSKEQSNALKQLVL